MAEVKKMNIEEWIQEQEDNSSITSEQFYARLVNAKNAIEVRLGAAKGDDVDLFDLDLDDEG